MPTYPSPEPPPPFVPPAHALRVPDGATLPHCVVCGLPLPKEDIGPLGVQSVPSWATLLWFVAWPVAVFAHLFLARRATLHLGFCTEHRRKRRKAGWARMGGFGLVIGNIAWFAYVAATDRDPASLSIFPPMLATVVALVFAMLIAQRPSYPQILEVQDGMVHLIPGPGYPVHAAAPAVLHPPQE